MIVNRLGRLYPTRMLLFAVLLFLLSLKMGKSLSLAALGLDIGMAPVPDTSPRSSTSAISC